MSEDKKFSLGRLFHRLNLWIRFNLLSPPSPPPPPVCKGAKADVVFVIDGSWSIGEESFTKVVHFVSEVVGAFDVIGPSGMQVTN